MRLSDKLNGKRRRTCFEGVEKDTENRKREIAILTLHLAYYVLTERIVFSMGCKGTKDVFILD